MFKIVIRINTRCPNHPRYSPERNGLKFRSGCSGCQRVWSIYQKAMELQNFLKGSDQNESTK